MTNDGVIQHKHINNPSPNLLMMLFMSNPLIKKSKITQGINIKKPKTPTIKTMNAISMLQVFQCLLYSFEI